MVRIAIDETNKSPQALSKDAFARFGKLVQLSGCTDTQGAATGKIAAGRIVTSNVAGAKAGFLALNQIDDPRQPIPPVVLRSLGTAPTLAKGEESGQVATMVTYRLLEAALGAAENTSSIGKGARQTVSAEDCMGAALQAGQTAERVLVPDQVQKKVFDRRWVQLELTKEQTQLLKSTNPGVEVQPIRDSIDIRFSASLSSDEMGDLPNSDELDQIGQALKRSSKNLKGRPKPILIILDDAWPTESAYRSTLEFFSKALPTAWTDVPPYVRGTLTMDLPPDLLKIQTLPPPAGFGCPKFEGCRTHAKRISEALEPFESAAISALGESPVNIIYLPLTKAQGPAAAMLLRSIWNFAYFAAPGGVLTGRPTANNELAYKTYVEQGDDYQTNGLSNQLNPAGMSIRSSGALVYSIFQFAKIYSKVSKIPIYINISWTTQDASFDFPRIRNEVESRVLGVVAAGNDCDPSLGCTMNLDESPVDLKPVVIARSSKEYIAVMNLNSADSPTCLSNRLPSSWYALAYPGRIADDCGTSFSSPRVAWLLAASIASGSQLQPKAWWRKLDALATKRERPCKTSQDYSCLRITTIQLFPPIAGSVSATKAVGTNNLKGLQ